MREIEKGIRPLSSETIPAVSAIDRVVGGELLAPSSLPFFSESLRDGYLLFLSDLKQAVEEGLPLVFEVAAGTLNAPRLQPGTAQRIFTGGEVTVVDGSASVIPFEWCWEEEGKLFVKEDAAVHRAPSYIRSEGEEVREGELLAAEGTRLGMLDIARLISLGIEKVCVHRKPEVALCCTGSELILPGDSLRRGEKYSVNDFIVEGGLRRRGVKVATSFAQDKEEELVRFFVENAPTHDLLLTTGGMGPGKYDLVRRAFQQAGGRILSDSLPMRPGILLLFGLLGDTPVLGLPGPPLAVQTLFHELILPVVCLLEGESRVWPERFEAALCEASGKMSSITRVRGGCLRWEDGQYTVRPVKRLESPNCHIFYPPFRQLQQGDLVEVHLISGS